MKKRKTNSAGRWIKRFLMAMLVVIIVVSFIGSIAVLKSVLSVFRLLENDPPAGEIKSDDVSQYMQYDSYVMNELEECFEGILPNEIKAETVAQYGYWYKCGILGFPNFSVLLSLQYDTPDEYREGIRHIEALIDQKADSSCYDNTYMIKGSLEEIELLQDEEIRDGMCYYFEIAQLDETNLKATMFAAQMYDGYVPDEELAVLRQVISEEDMLSMHNYAHAVPSQEIPSSCYWVGLTEETGEKAIMKTNGKGDTVLHQKVGDGYMLESCGSANIYYAASTDDGEWTIWEMFSNTPVATLSDPDIIRILAYHDQTIYYVARQNGVPTIIRVNNDNSTQMYPPGFNISEFDISWDDEFELWGIVEEDETIIVMMYSSTISENGIIAYCVKEGSAWSETPYSERIYYSTLDQSDIYVDEGSHPAWLDRNTLLYVGADSKLYRYDIDNGVSSPFITMEGSEITLPPMESEERMFVIDGEYIAYFRSYWQKGSCLSLQSLKNGKIYDIDSINSVELMDQILRIVLPSKK